MVGAPALAGLAALRMGAGLVQLATPASLLLTCLGLAPECIGLVLPEGNQRNRPGLHDAMQAADAVVAGCGMGQSPAARSSLDAVLTTDRPLLLDADALNLLAEGEQWWKRLPPHTLLTPHPGEMARLIARWQPAGKPPGKRAAPMSAAASPPRLPDDLPSRQALACAAAAAWGCTLLLKGHRTIVTDGRRVYVNRTGDSSLSKAGTGDVLAGMIGCLLAQGMPPLEAAALGAHLHGLAGQRAGRRLGRRCVLARDVIEELPAVLRAIEHPDKPGKPGARRR